MLGKFFVSIFAFFCLTVSVQAGMIKDQLLSNTEVPLPLKSMLSIADQLEVKFHTDSNVNMADFSKGGALQTNKLFLYEPYYKAKGQLLKPIEFVVDSASAYFTSLSEAYLVLTVEKSASNYKNFYESRARLIMSDVPVKFQIEAYRNAAAAFVGTIFSIAISAEKSYLRNGNKICAVFERPSSLFTHWQNQFLEGAPYPGEWYENNEWKMSKKVLTKTDKDEIIKNVLENFWTGDSLVDFKKRYCP